MTFASFRFPTSIDPLFLKILVTNSAGSRTGQASTCNGDSGGPLLTVDGLVQVGITSFGVNCDTVNLPNGFTRISYYYDWIQETICKYSNDRPSDCPELEGPDPDAVPVNVTIRVCRRGR